MNDNLGRSIIMGVAAVALMSYAMLAPEHAHKNKPARSLAWGQQGSDPAQLIVSPEAVINDWPGTAKKTAEAMILKYGQPSHVDDESLTWYNNGPWKKTVVYRQAYEGEYDAKSPSVLQQTITYRVPADRFTAVDSFDSRLTADRSREELSFRSDNEKKNFLAINLANEIVDHEKTPQEARDFYRKQISLMEAGKSSRYMDGLLFPVDNDNARP